VTTATGEYRVRGIELGFGGNITEKLSLFGGATPDGQRSAEKQATPTTLAKSSRIRTRSSSTYWPVTTSTTSGALAVKATWRGSVQGGTFAATNGNELPSHWRFDLMADYTSRMMPRSTSASITCWTKPTMTRLYRSGTPFVYVAPGRSASISVSNEVLSSHHWLAAQARAASRSPRKDTPCCSA